MSSVVAVEGVSKVFVQGGSRIEVLRSLDLSVESGDTLAILGRSGSGKSTLLSLLAGLDSPSSGVIRVAGKDLAQMDEKSLANFRALELAIVFQQFHLMSGLTALENVSLPLELASAPDAEERAREALVDVGLESRLDHMPSRLSGGERQRVAIARASVVKPKLLLADEPSGSLDQETGVTVMNLLFDLVEREKMTMILVTHNEQLSARCGRTLRLEQGRLK